MIWLHDQYNSASGTFSCWVKNGWSRSSVIVYLSLGSFSRQIKMKSLASSETFVAFENLISSYTYHKAHSYDFHEVLLSGDLEGNSAEEQFIGQYSNTPDIYFVIIGLSFKEFGRDIERSATESTTHGVGTDWPSEVTNLHESLSKRCNTQW